MRKLLISMFPARMMTALPGPALACSGDLDCAIGSKCVKAFGDLYAICAGGTAPRNSNDRRPVYAPLDINRTYGNTCQYDLDCGVGSMCYTSPNALQGVCVKER